MTVRETKKLMISAKVIVSASGRKRFRATPARKSTGKKTTMVVMVETKMGIATSWAAASTACLRLSERRVAMDVLELDDRVVHQPPDAQRQPSRA